MLICRKCHSIFEASTVDEYTCCPDCHARKFVTLEGANVGLPALPSLVDHLLQRVADLEARLASVETAKRYSGPI